MELPSQFMENWCYDKPTLYGFAKHFQTGEPLPEELFQKLKASKNFLSGLAMLRQLFFGAMDMRLHSEHFDPFGKQTPFEVGEHVEKYICRFARLFAYSKILLDALLT